VVSANFEPAWRKGDKKIFSPEALYIICFFFFFGEKFLMDRGEKFADAQVGGAFKSNI
jgi:hypothetical protein